MCPHARPDWRACPHCNGINSIPEEPCAFCRVGSCGVHGVLRAELATLRAQLADAVRVVEAVQEWKDTAHPDEVINGYQILILQALFQYNEKHGK